MRGDFFERAFEALTGSAPFGWQRRLFADHFLHGDIPAALDIPTGLGKTSVIVVWLIALAQQAESGRVRLPRRLVYVVNRRTVVDQATDIAERLREKLENASSGALIAQIKAGLSKLCIDPSDDAPPIAISTLRGERADNREWQADPARPAIIIGTVDMIGSRLLFSGYGVSRGMRPFHAGLLGQDTLLVHDEAHLSEPFGKLIHSIAEVQQAQKAPRPLRLMELSATQRKQNAAARFSLTDEEKAESPISQRLHAVKRLHIDEGAENDDAAVRKIVALALQYKDERKRVLVYVRRPQDARRIADELAKATDRAHVALLTGRVRGYERDVLAETNLFKGFRSDPDRQSPEATHYLVATSAGEVGVDLDADHLVCDLTTLDSMVQRLGRVNRLGGRVADIHVVEWPKAARKDQEEGEWDKRVAATKAAFTALPLREGAHDASPESLRALADQTEAFAPAPRTVPLTDILLDNWALTRVKDLPGRPMPERWLHGIDAGEPDVYVVWREEVSDLAAFVARDTRSGLRVVKQLYDKHAILARERLRGPLSVVAKELKQLAQRRSKLGEPDGPVSAVLLPVIGEPVFGTLSDLLDTHTPRLPNATIVLPPAAGGLDDHGMLDAKADPDASRRYDVSDEPVEGVVQRSRAWLTWREEEGRWAARWLGRDDSGALDAAVAGADSFGAAMRALREQAKPLVEKEAFELENGEGERVGALVLFALPRSPELAQDNPAASSVNKPLEDHLAEVECMAARICDCLGPLVEDRREAAGLAEAVCIAARFHDRGKDRDPWQADIGNPRPRQTGVPWEPLAKSERRGFVSRLSGAYRHEFGSLREASEDGAIRRHPERDLILHLIAAHHGWARPHFDRDQWDIADGVTEEENAAVAAQAMRRFARLQCRFGHWGLAWLEALVRAADYTASGRVAAYAGPTAPAPLAPADAAAKGTAT